MWKTRAAAALIVTTLSTAAAADDNAKKVIDDASKAMGIAGMNSVAYAGAAAIGNWGQSRTISFGLASTKIQNYVRAIDFDKPALRVTYRLQEIGEPTLADVLAAEGLLEQPTPVP